MLPTDREAIQKECNQIALLEIREASRGRGNPRAYEILRQKHVIEDALLPANRYEEREALIALVEQIANVVDRRNETNASTRGALERELNNLRTRMTSRPHFVRCLSAHEGSLRDLMDLAYAEGRDALAAALVLRAVISDQLAKNVQLSDEAAEAAHALASGHLRIPRERRKKDVRDRLIIKVMKQIRETFPKLRVRHNDETKKFNDVSAADFALRALRANGERGLTQSIIANAWKSHEKQDDLRDVEAGRQNEDLAADLVGKIEEAEASGETVKGRAPFAFDGVSKLDRT